MLQFNSVNECFCCVAAVGLGFASPHSANTASPSDGGSAGLGGDWRKKMDLSIRSNEDRDTGKENQGPAKTGSAKASPVVGQS